MDRYELEARHAPAALGVLPLVIIAFYLVPSLSTSIAVPAGFSALAVAAVYAWLARVARSYGIEAQHKLFAAWGGAPTTAMLRHRDQLLNPHTRSRYHDEMRKLGSQFEIPTATDELADAAAA